MAKKQAHALPRNLLPNSANGVVVNAEHTALIRDSWRMRA